MHTVLLITYRNNIYRESIINNGYSLTEYKQPLSPNDIQELHRIPTSDFIIIEVNDGNINTELFNSIANKGRIICYVNKMSVNIKKFLLKTGISDVIQFEGSERLLSYMNVFKQDKKENIGKIIIIDDDTNSIKILKNIINRFNYVPLIMKSINDLFDNLNQVNIQFILINLSVSELDLNSLIRRSFANTEIKRIPLIAYKDMNKGLFVHEVISGLNRLTRYILSPEELFSFLIDIFFKKEIIPLLDVLNKLCNYNNYSDWIKGTLSQVYNLHGNKIFDLENLLYEDNYLTMTAAIEQINESTIKVDGLKWLRIESDAVNFNTCGVGGEYLHRPS